MKSMRKILSIALALLTLVGILAGCGGDTTPVETDPSGNKVQNKTCIVKYVSSGHGHSWLQVLADKFNEMYAEEGYKIELQIDFGGGLNAAAEIMKGADKCDVDIFMGSGGLEDCLNASKKIMRGEGAALVDLRDVVWNKPAIGLDKQEEERTIGERYTNDEQFLLYDGLLEEYHGGLYMIGFMGGSAGILMNPKVTEKYGYGMDNLPRTTDEFNEMCHTIAATSEETGIYPYSWAGSNAPGYITYLFFEYHAQYSGYEKYLNFVKCIPESGDVKNDGWQVYEDPGILEGFKAMEPIMKLKYSPKGSASDTHLEAQHRFLTGETAFMMNGDWVLNEMEDEYYEEASQCIMLNTPVLSVIGTESGITDAELSEAVGMIDEGKTDEEIMAAISGLDAKETARIREARNIYGNGEASLKSGACIPAFSDAIDVAILFLRFITSEDGCQIIRDEAYNVPPYLCETYASKGNTPYMDSVVANINPGKGVMISMDATLAPIRSVSGMLYFNHPQVVQPATFRFMITDTTGELTAQKMFDMEREYARSHWAQWAAYIQ